MKIYLPACLAISALAIITTNAHSMEKVGSNAKTPTNTNTAISFSASRLDSETADIIGFDRTKENPILDLSGTNNSFTLNNISTSDSAIKSENLGRVGYSATTEILKF